MRRHVIGVSRCWRDLGVHPCGSQAFLGEQGVVIAVDDVMRYAGMVRLPGKNGFEDFTTLALIAKRFIGLGSGDGEGERMENGSLVVLGIGGLYIAHLFL